MGKHENIIPIAPPAPTAKAVLAHRKKLEIERDGLRAGAAELALKSALGDLDARAALAAIPAKAAALQFEIDMHHETHELAHKLDAAAEAAWRTSLESMDVEDLLEGLGGDNCCRLCQIGTPGGCVITGAHPFAGATCGHPVREKNSVFGRDETGTRQFLYRHNPQALKVFTAACQKLKVKDR
jgi:hypothetical protein